MCMRKKLLAILLLAVLSALAIASTEYFGEECNYYPIYSRIKYGYPRGGMSGTEWMGFSLGTYQLVDADTGSQFYIDVLDLNDYMASGWQWEWLRDNLQQAQLRIDGTFYVDSLRAGEWQIQQKFDDYFSFFIDGNMVLYNNSYLDFVEASVNVSEGWHSFKIVCGDTYGGYGSNNDFGGTVGWCPFKISVNGAEYAFSSGDFRMGEKYNVASIGPGKLVECQKMVMRPGTVLELTSSTVIVERVVSDGPSAIVGMGDDASVVKMRMPEKLGDISDGLDNIAFGGRVDVVSLYSGVSNDMDRIELGYANGSGVMEFSGDGTILRLVKGISGIGGNFSGRWMHYGGLLETLPGTEFKIGDYGSGELYQTGGKIVIGEWMSVGRGVNGTGVYSVSNGCLEITRDYRPLWIGGADGSKGVMKICGTSEVSVAGSVFLGGNLGQGVSNEAGLEILGGKLRIGGHLRSSENSGAMGTKAYVIQTGGEMTVGGDVNIPSFQGEGAFVSSGGVARVSGPAFIGCGNYNNDTRRSVGSLLIDGGSFTAGGGIILGAHVGGYGSMTVRHPSAVSGVPFIDSGDGFGSLSLSGCAIDGCRIGSLLNYVWMSGTNVFDGCSLLCQNVRASSNGKLILRGSNSFGPSIPPVGEIVLENGASMNLPSDEGTVVDNSPGVKLVHRWRFDGDLNDEVTGAECSVIGSGNVFADGGIKLPGGSKGSCYVDLGGSVVPSSDFTVEMWFTPLEERDWVRGFVIGGDGVDPIVFTQRRYAGERHHCNFDLYNNVIMGYGSGCVLETNKMYYVAASFCPSEDGSATSINLCVIEDGQKYPAWSCGFKKDGWTVDFLKYTFFWLGHSNGNDNDTMAEYHDVRVWDGALGGESMLLSASYGPDAGPAKVSEIANVANGGNLVERVISMTSGSTISGASLIQPIVKGTGGLRLTGGLKISKKLVVSSKDMLVNDGVVDLSGAEIEISDPDSISGALTFMMCINGGSVVGTPALPDGWVYGYDDGMCTVSNIYAEASGDAY